MAEFEQTDDTLTDEQLADMHRCDDDPEFLDYVKSKDTIGVCDGEWRREGPGWRFWRNSEIEA